MTELTVIARDDINFRLTFLVGFQRNPLRADFFDSGFTEHQSRLYRIEPKNTNNRTCQIN